MSTTDDPRTEGAEREACAHPIRYNLNGARYCHDCHVQITTTLSVFEDSQAVIDTVAGGRVRHAEGVGAGDVEALGILRMACDGEFKRAVNVGLDDFRMGRKSNDGLARDLARAVLASDWLAADRAAARAEGARSVAERVEAVAADLERIHGHHVVPPAMLGGSAPWHVIRAALTDPAPDTTASEEER